MSGPFQAAGRWRAAGWLGTLPLPALKKASPPAGFTGALHSGVYPAAEQVESWLRSHADGNLAIRLPEGVVGVDVDAYGDKPGAETLAGLEAELGPLPATWVSTSREAPSGIRLFRVPDGLVVPGDFGPGVEVIRSDWRYFVAWPSIHPNGRVYRLVAPGGQDCEEPPRPDELPLLPAAWVARFASAPEPAESADYPPAPERREEVPHRAVATVYGRHSEALASPGSRHNAAAAGALALARLEQRGFPGSTTALDRFGAEFRAAVTRPGEGQRTGPEADREWQSIEETARVKARTTPSDAPPYDPWWDADPNYPPDGIDTGGPAEPPDAGRREAGVSEVGGRGGARFARGGDLILDQPEEIPAVWGRGEQVLWAQGEALLIAAPPGCGKTTLATQLVFARLGLIDGVLGWPVAHGQRILYLACDRPRQILRAFRRLAEEGHREVLNERLVFWQGPPPGDFAKTPALLAEMARAEEADTVVLDSLKDVAIGLTDDEVGAGLNASIQTAIAAGVEVLGLHHHRKAQQGSSAPKTLAEVYGSVWITSGAGSVIGLWGEPGDPVVDLVHLKQPAEDVGPLKVEHDHRLGRSKLAEGVDLLAVLSLSADGLTVGDAARLLFDRERPTEADRKKAERRLKGLVSKGYAREQPAQRGGAGGSRPARYFAAGVELGEVA